MGKKRDLTFKIAEMVCNDCSRAKDCTECPVRQLVDVYNEKSVDIVERELITGQHIDYLLRVGVLYDDGFRIGLVKAPGTNPKFSVHLLHGFMYDDLVSDKHKIVRVGVNNNAVHGMKSPWIVPEWMFMDTQEEIMRTYFGSKR